jgi:hypothetical protein
MKKVAAICLGLCACTPAPDMAPEDARAIVEAVGRGAGDLNLCAADGRARYRAAVRVHSASMAAQGVDWPDLSAASGRDVADPDEIAVLGAMMLGWVKASDLKGKSGGLAKMLSLSTAAMPEAARLRRGAESACPEILALQRNLAGQMLDMRTLQREVDRARERDDPERVHDLADRVQRRQRVAQAQAERLAKQIEAKVAATP